MITADKTFLRSYYKKKRLSLRNQEIENIVENTSSEEEKSFSQEAINGSEIKDKISNDLKEFGVDIDEPDLFSSDQNSDSENFLNSSPLSV